MTRVVLCVQNMDVPDDPRVWNEATSLARAGYDVTVVAPRSAGSPDAERIDGVDVVRYRTARERPGTVGQLLEAAAGFVGTARLVMRIRKNGPIAVLHVANPPDTLFPLAWWLRRSGTRFVYDQHDPTPELLAAKLGRRPLLDRVLRLPRATHVRRRRPRHRLQQLASTARHRPRRTRRRARRHRPARASRRRAAARAPDDPDGGLRRRDGFPGHRRGAHRRLRRGAATATWRGAPRAHRNGRCRRPACVDASPNTASTTPSPGQDGSPGTRCDDVSRRPPSACRPTSTTRTRASRR